MIRQDKLNHQQNSHHNETQNELEIDQTSRFKIESFNTAQNIHRDNYHQQQKSEISGSKLFFFIVTFFIIVVAYILYDSYRQEKEILSIIEKIKNRTKQFGIEIKQDLDKFNHSALQDIIRTSNLNDKQQNASQILKIQFKQKQFSTDAIDEIPRRAWYFSDKKMNESTLWTQKCFQAYQNTIQKMDYQFIAFDISDYSKYIPPERYYFIQQQIKHLNLRYQRGDQPQIIKYQDLIIRQLITLQVLIQNGGIYLDQDIILTEDLTWINQISANIYVNARQFIQKPQLVAFHSINLSPEPTKYNQTNVDQVQKYIILNPTISPYFLGAVKNCAFLKDLRSQYYALLDEKKNLKELVRNQSLQIDFQQKYINYYKYLFQISSQIALHKKQSSLKNKNTHALKYYQIATINQNFGPTKLTVFLPDLQKVKILKHLSQIIKQQLQFQFGAMRYMIKLQPKEDFQDLLLEFVEKNQIIAKSLIHQALFQSAPYPFITQIKNQQFQSNQIWSALPSKIWIYNKVSNESSILHQIWLSHLQIISSQSNFELTILNQQNLHQYLEQQTIQMIDKAIKNKNNNLVISRDSKTEMLSLAILYKYGGIWLEPQTFLTQGLQWIRKINQQKFIWNKNGKLPKIVMAFHPHYGPPFDWKYNQKGIKQAWEIGYQKNFIASQAKAQLLKDWLKQHIINLGMSFDDLKNKFYGNKMSYNRWITDFNHQQLFIDSIKSTLGIKKTQFIIDEENTTPNQYYGLWAINGFISYLKMRQHTNFILPKNNPNPSAWRLKLGQLEEIGGKIHFFTTIYPTQSAKIQELCRSNIKNLQNEFHHDSFLMKALHKTNKTIFLQNNQLFIQNQQVRSNFLIQKQQFLQKNANTVWLYQQANEQNTFLQQKKHQRMTQYINPSTFTIVIVNISTYSNWLPQQTNSEISQFINQLRKRLNHQKSNLIDHYQNILQQFITLSLLQHNGGVVLDNKLILLQSLTWIKQIEKQSFINKEGKSKAKVFAFYSPGSTPKISANQHNQSYIEFPSLQNYLIAAGKNTSFIFDLRREFKRIILQKSHIKEEVKSFGHQTGWLKGNDPYYEAFFLSSQIVLTKKHRQLIAANISRTAIDYYGLYTINSRYIVSKLSNFVSMLQINQESFSGLVAKSSTNELENYIGKLKYLVILPKEDEINQYILNNTKKEQEYSIVEGSFLHKYIIGQSQMKGITKYQKDNNDNKGGQWSSLSSFAWIMDDREGKQYLLIHKMIISHLGSAFSKDGYQIRVINDENIKQYLTQDELTKIKKIVLQKNNKIHKFHLYKLFLLQKYGGIAVNPNLIMTQEVGWIKNISNFSEQFMFNKFSDNPSALMFAGHLRSSRNKWNYSKTYKTKVGHRIGWNDDFIAAQKNSLLIKEWLSEFMSLLEKDENAQLKVFQQCKIKQQKKDKSTLRLDSLSCLLNRKQLQLQKQNEAKQAGIYYKLWGISQFIGMAKLEDQISLDRNQYELNPFLWKWNQTDVQSLIGNIQMMAHLSNRQLSLVEEFTKKYMLQAWTQKNSLLQRTLFQSTKQKLKIQNGKVQFIE